MTQVEGILTHEKDADLIKQVIEDVVSRRGYKDIRANLEGYEAPARLSRAADDNDEAYVPDITGVLNGRKSYFELAMKTEQDQVQVLITKWKLMSNLANYKRGKLYLVAPRGHYAFANRILTKYLIEAELIKM